MTTKTYRWIKGKNPVESTHFGKSEIENIPCIEGVHCFHDNPNICCKCGKLKSDSTG